MDFCQHLCLINKRENIHFFRITVAFVSVCSSEPENLQAAPQNLSSILVMWERPRAVYDDSIEKYSISYRVANADQEAFSEFLTDGYQDTVSSMQEIFRTDLLLCMFCKISQKTLDGCK